MNYLKSGSLFEAAGALGGLSGSDNPQDVEKLSLFGKYFGNAYQIRDDIIDAFNPKNNANSPNNDLLNGDPSLLFLYAINSKTISNGDKQRIKSIYTGENKDLNVGHVRTIFEDTGALRESVNKMQEYSKLAGGILEQYHDSDAKESLYELLDQYNHDFINQPETMLLEFINVL
jgi:geranylgeranyl pyrophosphate synthase